MKTLASISHIYKKVSVLVTVLTPVSNKTLVPFLIQRFNVFLYWCNNKFGSIPSVYCIDLGIQVVRLCSHNLLDLQFYSRIRNLSPVLRKTQIANIDLYCLSMKVLISTINLMTVKHNLIGYFLFIRDICVAEKVVIFSDVVGHYISIIASIYN